LILTLIKGIDRYASTIGHDPIAFPWSSGLSAAECRL
jgi:hypothetical protein